MKKNALNIALGTALLAGVGAAQAVMVFDFNNGQGAMEIGSWDWQQTSFLAQNGNLAVANYATGNCNPISNCQFTVYVHQKLTGATRPDGSNITINGLNQSFEITTVWSFTETVNGLGGVPGTNNAIAFFDIDTTEDSFFNVFYDTSVDATPLSGSGFDDGKLILTSSEVQDSSGLFRITSAAFSSLDQSGDDDYDGADNSTGDPVPGTSGASQLSVQGFGTQDNISFNIQDGDYDTAYFKSQFSTVSLTDATFQSISIGNPFITITPSDCFTTGIGNSGASVGGSAVANGGGACDTNHVDGLYSEQEALTNTDAYLPVVGTVNGAPIGSGGDVDFVALTDNNMAFDAEAIPEPNTLAVLGLGLGALGFVGYRRRTRKS